MHEALGKGALSGPRYGLLRLLIWLRRDRPVEAGALRQVAWPARAEAGRLLGPGPSQCPRLPFLRSTSSDPSLRG